MNILLLYLNFSNCFVILTSFRVYLPFMFTNKYIINSTYLSPLEESKKILIKRGCETRHNEHLSCKYFLKNKKYLKN